jgi:DNA-binding response OmpR family regulator
MPSQQSSLGQTILVIDDDPDVRGMLGILLNHAGYDVVTAVDGADGLARAGDQRIGLVLLDIHMPRLEGDAFCRAYREHGGRAPIIVITAAEVDRETVTRYGADAYIAKPFDIDVVQQTVAQYLKNGG